MRARPGPCLLSCLYDEHRGNMCHKRLVRVPGRCSLRRFQSLTLNTCGVVLTTILICFSVISLLPSVPPMLGWVPSETEVSAYFP